MTLHRYLENNLFVYMVRRAFEDGFMADAEDDDTAKKSDLRFAKTASLLAIPALQKARSGKKHPLNGMIEPQDEHDDEIPKTRCKNLQDIIEKARLYGRLRRLTYECPPYKEDNEEIEKWVKSLGRVQIYSASFDLSYEYAVKTALDNDEMRDAGEYLKAWKISNIHHLDTVIATYHADLLSEGDIVEYGRRVFCKVVRVNNSTAEVKKIGLMGETLDPFDKTIQPRVKFLDRFAVPSDVETRKIMPVGNRVPEPVPRTFKEVINQVEIKKKRKGGRKDRKTVRKKSVRLQG